MGYGKRVRGGIKTDKELIIKFSHSTYTKFPDYYEKSKLLELFIMNRDDLSEDFVKYDTAWVYIKPHFTPEGRVEKSKIFNYPLPEGTLIILLLQANEGYGALWTTIRRYTERKYKYYKFNIGKILKIVIEEI